MVAMDCAEDTERMRAAYERRRNLLVAGMADIPGVELIAPEGAFYARVKYGTDMDSATLCNRLLEEAKIAGVPGDAYGEENVTCVRFSFAAAEEDLARMLRYLKEFMNNQ